MRIQKLSPLLANQIAAGEVIERPASVVKELLENCIDAKATRISIHIEKAGKQLIHIRDNGVGIHRDDLSLAVSSHATSKIFSVDDLTAITSLGFRGEALASIASVSTLKIISCLADQEIAAVIEVTGGEEKILEKSAAHPPGTTVEVQQLFYNTPARRKFLRSDQTEFSQIEDVVKRVALSHFECAFILKHHDKVIFNLAQANQQTEKDRRVIKLFGQSFMKEARWIDTVAAGLRLWGWIALPSFMRSQTDLQYFYINGRMVKDKLISHAIRKAYQELLFEGRHPAYILHLEIDAAECDVNVHPTKHEVRFEQARLVHDFIFSRLFQVINQTNVSEKLSHEVFPIRKIAENFAHYEIRTSSENEHGVKQEVIAQTQEFFGKPIGIFKTDYLLTEHVKGLFVIHIASAQRIIFSKHYLAAIESNALISKPLLFPQRISLDEALCDLLQEHSDELMAYGLPVERIATNCLVIREIPEILLQADLLSLYHGLAEQWKINPKLNLSVELIATSAIKTGEMTTNQQYEILNQLTALGLTKNSLIAPFCKLIPMTNLVID